MRTQEVIALMQLLDSLDAALEAAGGINSREQGVMELTVPQLFARIATNGIRFVHVPSEVQP